MQRSSLKEKQYGHVPNAVFHVIVSWQFKRKIKHKVIFRSSPSRTAQVYVSCRYRPKWAYGKLKSTSWQIYIFSKNRQVVVITATHHFTWTGRDILPKSRKLPESKKKKATKKPPQKRTNGGQLAIGGGKITGSSSEVPRKKQRQHQPARVS